MTRLQTKGSPCECGKTTKAVESFVTKTKFYETRSSDRKSRSFFLERGKKLNGERNYHRQLYLQKPLNSHLRSPNKERQRSFPDAESVVKVIKTIPGSDEKKPTTNGTDTHLLIQAPFAGMISKELEMELLKSKCIRSNADLKVNSNSNDSFSNGNGMVSKKVEKEYQEENPFQNGVQGNGQKGLQNGHSWTSFEIKDCATKEEIFQINDEEITDESPLGLEELVEDNCNANDSPTNQPSLKKKKRKPRTTKFQSLLECASELRLSLAEKRSRKRPENFSPPLNKRKVIAMEISDDKTPEKNLTLSGKQRKRCGRKPKYKGPVLHYLDVYIKRKTTPLVIKSEDSIKPNEEGSTVSSSAPQHDDTTNTTVAIEPSTKKKILEIHSQCSSSSTPSSLNVYRPSIAMQSQSKKVKIPKEKPKKKVIPKKTTKLYSKEFDSAIISVLGHRSIAGKNELLVLFENGTSNWIAEEIEGTALFDQLDTFYDHPEQDLSSLHRISYNLTQQIKRKHIDSVSCSLSSESESESDDSSDSDIEDDVFYNRMSAHNKVCLLPLPVNSLVTGNSRSLSNVPKQLGEINDVTSENHNNDDNKIAQPASLQEINDNDEFSTSDLNELCNYVMSSRHIKLYPCESTKEIVSKVDGEFVHVYLKRFNKNQPQEQSKRIEGCLNIKTCETLITLLEDCAINFVCNVVVISGIEDFFSWNGVFDKLLKKSAIVEGKKYEHDIAIIRYLVQTIKNFTKPIVAVIRKTASGLPASIISLFDMVFDEKKMKNHPVRIPVKVSKRRVSKPPSTNSSPRALRHNHRQQSSADESAVSDYETVESFQNYVFPRLMGLTDRNEAQIMGEHYTFTTPVDDEFDGDIYCCHTLTDPLRNSLRHMKNNSKIKLKIRNRSHSCNSDENVDFTEDINKTQSSILRQDSDLSQNQMDELAHQVKQEREQTKKYMEDLSSLLKNLESQS